MAHCDVLRCTNLALHLWTYGDPEGPALEGGVCDAHHERMQAGELYAVHGGSLEDRANSFVMGEDLAALGYGTLTRAGVRFGPVELADRTRPVVLNLQATRYGDDAPLALSIFLTADAARELRAALEWAPPAE